MSENMKANYVDHISIAVRNLEKAVKDFEKMFGWEVAGRYIDREERISVVYFMVGPTAVELMEDIDGKGEVARFIEHHGEGIMVLSFNVDNCEDSLEILRRNMTKVIDDKPRFTKALNRYYAFIHPKACYGVLTEVIDGEYEPNPDSHIKKISE